MLAAAGEGRQRFVYDLITAGVDLEVRAEMMITRVPFISISIEKGHESVVRILLQLGADVNIRGYGNNTPLMLAAEAGQHKIAKLLISKGPDLNLQDVLPDLILSFTYVSGAFDWKDLCNCQARVQSPKVKIKANLLF